jgi:hypothetical protein
MTIGIKILWIKKYRGATSYLKLMLNIGLFEKKHTSKYKLETLYLRKMFISNIEAYISIVHKDVIQHLDILYI